MLLLLFPAAGCRLGSTNGWFSSDAPAAGDDSLLSEPFSSESSLLPSNCFSCCKLCNVRSRLLSGPVIPEVEGADSGAAEAELGPETEAVRLAGIPVKAKPMLNGG